MEKVFWIISNYEEPSALSDGPRLVEIKRFNAATTKKTLSQPNSQKPDLNSFHDSAGYSSPYNQRLGQASIKYEGFSED